ncbi:MAG: T9SS type A sorting domain-containing protein [Ignavibacteriae bacterium]|nr:T9SS type A sorting domain-containing protein [Ignavibacteriota bacterium]
MNIGQRFVVLLCVVQAIAISSPAQTNISHSQFTSYFNVGQPIRLLVDTTIFSSETPMVYVGHQGGSNVYDFSSAVFVEYASDTLDSVSENEFLAERFPPQYFTFDIPNDEGGGFENPILSITDTTFTTMGQYRFYTSDSVRVRHGQEFLFGFPVEFGDSVRVVGMHAETTYVSDSPVEMQSFERTQEVVVDGWGTVNLPNGLEVNALRMRDTEVYEAPDFFTGKSFRFLLESGGAFVGMIFVESMNDQPDTGWVAVDAPIQYIINPSITAAEVPTEPPTGFELAQNYPNPFNPETSIRYSLPVGSKVRLTVYSILGQELAVLDEGEKSAGWHTIRWNAVSQPSGIYFVRLQAGSFVSTRKVVLLK